MSKPRVEFIFDFGSPNAYLSHLVLPRIVDRTGVDFDYVPCLLGGIFKLTHNVSPAVSLQGIKNKPEYNRLEMRRFIDRHGITSFESNPHFPVNTLLIMRGAIFAKDQDFFTRYVDEVYRHMWSEPKKMDDPEVVHAALDESGLPADRILEATRDGAIKQRLIDNTGRAVERGVFGSPSFFVGNELFFGKDRLRDVEDEIRRQLDD